MKQRIRNFLAPSDGAGGGWLLRRPVIRLELMAEVSRVPGVALVNSLLLALATGDSLDTITTKGLELPRLDGIEVAVGADPLPLDQLRGTVSPTATTTPKAKRMVPVPAIPAEC